MNRRSDLPCARASFVLVALSALVVATSQGCIVKGAYEEYCEESGKCPDAGSSVGDAGRSDGGDGGGAGSDAGSDGGFDAGSCFTAGGTLCGTSNCCIPPNQMCGTNGNCCTGDFQACTSNAQCCSGSCDLGQQKCMQNCLGPGATCSQGGTICCNGNVCDPTQNKCVPGGGTSCFADNTPCGDDRGCCSGRCQGGFCQQCESNIGNSCDSRTDCCLAPGFGATTQPLRCSDSFVCNGATGTAPDGGACFKENYTCLPNDTCCFGECSAQACPSAPLATCNATSACNNYGGCCMGYACNLSSGMCSPWSGGLRSNDFACRHHKECQSGYCDMSQPPGKWRCATPNPAACVKLGNTCTTPAECCGNPLTGCITGKCCMQPGDACGDANDCCPPPGGSGSAVCVRGVCQIQTGTTTCAPISSQACQRLDGSLCKSFGAPCAVAQDCCSGNCSGTTCGL